MCKKLWWCCCYEHDNKFVMVVVVLLLLRFRNHSIGFVAKSADVGAVVRTSKRQLCEERCGIAAGIGMKIQLALSVPCLSGSNALRIPPGLNILVWNCRTSNSGYPFWQSFLAILSSYPLWRSFLAILSGDPF